MTPFAGYVGLAVPRFEAHFTPCVEIAWRLAAQFWGTQARFRITRDSPKVTRFGAMFSIGREWRARQSKAVS